MSIMSPRTKQIYLPCNLFWSKDKSIEIEVLSINTNNQLEEQLTKVLQEVYFELAQKDIIKW